MKLRVLSGSENEIRELQRVLEGAPLYSERVAGHRPGPDEAAAIFTALPPGYGDEDKFVFGIYLRNQALGNETCEQMIGCIDLIRGYPDRRTAMLGLLLVQESEQAKGLGKEAYRLLEDFVRNWSHLEKIRIGVVLTNSRVLEFWKKQGFRDIGIRKPYQCDRVSSETVVLEKSVLSTKSRYTMRAELKKPALASGALALDKFATRQAGVEDAELIASLMERAYCGTIDDEGEIFSHYLSETRASMKGKYGAYISDASFWIEKEGKAVSATMVTMWKEKPLLAFSVTDPEYQGQGMARFLISKTMNKMAELGYSQIDLGVTHGNLAAEHLYRKMGFIRVS